jgi:hypothetical protein
MKEKMPEDGEGEEEGGEEVNQPILSGHVRLVNGNWRPIKYVPSPNGIAIEEPESVITECSGASVVVKLSDGTDRTGFANESGRINFDPLREKLPRV